MAVSPAYILIQIQNYMPQYMQVVELAHISSQGHTLCYIIINKSEVAQFSISHMEVVTSGEIRICARFKNKWKKSCILQPNFNSVEQMFTFYPS